MMTTTENVYDSEPPMSHDLDNGNGRHRIVKSVQGHSTNFESLQGSRTITPGELAITQNEDKEVFSRLYYGRNDLIKV